MSARRQEVLSLYRTLLKNANRFPTSARREVTASEIKVAFRQPQNEGLTPTELDYKLSLGWERASAIGTYATNMYWFHSRDEVTKEMLHHSQQRDRARIEEMERLRREADAQVLTEKATKFESTFENVSPGYAKVAKTGKLGASDVWRARGQHTSDAGGPKQKFFVKRYKAVFPQGW